jgi:hypothetical protein
MLSFAFLSALLLPGHPRRTDVRLLFPFLQPSNLIPQPLDLIPQLMNLLEQYCILSYQFSVLYQQLVVCRMSEVGYLLK